MTNPKLITDRQLLGSMGVALLEGVLARMGYVWRASSQHDAGIDGEIELRGADGAMSGQIIKVQSRALSTLANESEAGFDYWPKKRDIDYWLAHNLPVILVISRPSTSEIYWKHVQGGTSNQRAIHFEKSKDRLHDESKFALAQLTLNPRGGTTPVKLVKREEWMANLLPVSKIPETLFLAETPYRTSKELGEELARINGGVPKGSTYLQFEFVLKNQRVLTVRDLTDPRYVQFCDRGTVEDFPSWEWAEADDPDKQRDFVQLLNRCLRAFCSGLPERLKFDKDSGCFYFPASKTLKPYDYSYRGQKKETAREVFKELINKKAGHVMGFRHSAMLPKFYRYGHAWYLEVTPTYLFTGPNGKDKSRYHEDWLKRIKEFEKNNAVRGQFLMWADLLGSSGDLLSAPYPYLQLGRPVVFSTDDGIDDASWTNSDDSEPTDGAKMGFLFQGI